MAYARLDVFWPDGKFESFLLETDTVSVGRAPGNTIALETDTISRYHFSLTHTIDQTSITDLDSANGTFVDGVRLDSNQSRVLDGVEEIQIGNLRMIFQLVDDSPTIPVAAAVEEETQESKPEPGTFEIGLDKLNLSVWPASSNSVEVAISNYDTKPHIYSVQVTGMPKEWVRLNHPHLEIGPDDTNYVLINIRPVRRSDTAPGIYPMTISVHPREQPEQTKSVPLQVTIEGYKGFGMALITPELDTGDEFQMYLHNQGNTPLDVELDGSAPQGGLLFNLPESPLQLAAGKRVQVRGTISAAERPLMGAAQQKRFHLHARLRDTARSLLVAEGTINIAPVMPTWAAITAAGLAVSAVLIILLVIGGSLFAPPNPQIIRFDVNSTQVPRGSNIVLMWDATDVSSYSLQLNGTPQPDVIASNRNSYEIDAGDTSGTLEIVLRGVNGDVETIATQVVQVYQPVRAGRFDVLPRELTRYVVSSLSINWDIPGATTVRISGVDAFSNAPLNDRYTSQGSIEDITGIPTTPFSILLHAEDEAGNVVEQSFDITLLNPECTTDEDLSLREGPDMAHQVISQVEAGDVLIVDAQDETGNWLRTTLPGDIQGWAPRNGYTCAETFNVAELRKAIDAPPPPTPTLQPSPTAIPTQALTPPTLQPTPSPTPET